MIFTFSTFLFEDIEVSIIPTETYGFDKSAGKVLQDDFVVLSITPTETKIARMSLLFKSPDDLRRFQKLLRGIIQQVAKFLNEFDNPNNDD